MKTIVHIVLSDEERNHLAKMWFGRKSMVSRKEVIEHVLAEIQEQLTLRERQEETKAVEAKEIATPEQKPFVPSRGDEEYLYKPKSVELKDACSKMLDLAEEVERLTWEVLEDNRATT